MKLSNNFYLREFIVSPTARRLDIDNTPNDDVISNIKELCINILQPAREWLKSPISVTSGYRCPVLNKAIGGARNSQHTKGEAADIHCKNNKALFEFIKNNLIFDQLIWEFGNDNNPEWIHVSYNSNNNRGEILKAFKQNNRTTYERI